MKHILPSLFLVAAFVTIPFANANIPLMSPMGALIIGPIIVAAIFTIIIEVVIVLVLLRKESLRIIRLAFILFFVNIISFVLFLILLPSLFAQPSNYLIIVSEVLVILFEAFMLYKATELASLRKPGGMPLTFKKALVPVLISNIAAILFGIFLLNLLSGSSPPKETEKSVSSQGTWETTLEARDFDNDYNTVEGYYDTLLGVTWLSDANLYGAELTWDSANAWASNLNYHGIDDWRLPNEKPINSSEFDFARSENATTDAGNAATTTDGTDGGWRNLSGEPVSEMGHMYYVTLGNDSIYPGMTNSGPFSNIQSSRYWSAAEDIYLSSEVAWTFDFGWIGKGDREILNKLDNAYIWPVHDGDVGTPISRAPLSTE